jgi:hypothetical protein
VNARTSRLLARVAHLHHLRDPRPIRQPEASVLADLKAAWNRTPPAKRDETRRALVAIAYALIKGDSRG